MTSMMTDTKPNQFYFETATQTKMTNVKTALANYAHRNYRIPCPADPSESTASAFGTEAGLNGDNVCSSTIGILPFRALGLTEDAAKDEWGNYFTYKVSPDFTRMLDVDDDDDFEKIGDPNQEQLLIAASGTKNYVHEICRTPNWTTVKQPGFIMSDGNINTSIGTPNVNQNIFKARFCCPSNVIDDGDDSEIKFTAEANAWQNGKTADLDEDGDGEGEGKVLLSIGGLSSDMVLIDENVPVPWSNSGRTWGEFINSVSGQAHSDRLIYNKMLYHDGKPTGSGLGPVWADPDNPGQPAPWSGKFHHRSAVFDIQTQNGVSVRDFTMGLSEIGENNWHDPVEIEMDVVDKEGNPIDTITYVVQLPEAPEGIGEISFSLDAIMGEANQDGLFHSGSIDGRAWSNGNMQAGFLPASAAEEAFNASKASLIDKLDKAGLTIEDVQVGKLKLYASPASLAFNSFTFGSPATPALDNTDLIVRNEKLDDTASRRLPERNNREAYKSTDILHDAPVSTDFEAAAYALISHGLNGEGAYLAGGAKIDNIPDADENPFEVDNHSGGREVRDVRKITSNDPTETFDDIIMWDSQITLYNALRNGTCEASQAM